jgi:hypothetical protein
VPAEHDDHRALAAHRGRDGVDDLEQVVRLQDVGERSQERAEGAIALRRRAELLGAYLVRAQPDRDGADGGEVGLALR